MMVISTFLIMSLSEVCKGLIAVQNVYIKEQVRLGDLPKVTQLVHQRAGTRTQSPTPEPTLSPGEAPYEGPTQWCVCMEGNMAGENSKVGKGDGLQSRAVLGSNLTLHNLIRIPVQNWDVTTIHGLVLRTEGDCERVASRMCQMLSKHQLVLLLLMCLDLRS